MWSTSSSGIEWGSVRANCSHSRAGSLKHCDEKLKGRAGDKSLVMFYKSAILGEPSKSMLPLFLPRIVNPCEDPQQSFKKCALLASHSAVYGLPEVTHTHSGRPHVHSYCINVILLVVDSSVLLRSLGGKILPPTENNEWRRKGAHASKEQKRRCDFAKQHSIRRVVTDSDGEAYITFVFE